MIDIIINLPLRNFPSTTGPNGSSKDVALICSCAVIISENARFFLFRHSIASSSLQPRIPRNSLESQRNRICKDNNFKKN